MGTAASTWRVRVLASLELLDYEVATSPGLPAPARGFAQRMIAEATEAANRPRSLASAWYGTAIDEAWLKAHAVDVMLVRYADPGNAGHVVADALARAGNALKPSDARLVALTAATKKGTAPDADTVALAANALAASYDASDADHRKVRDFRNVLIAATGVLTVFAIVLGVVCFWAPDAVNLCWPATAHDLCPTGRTKPSGGDAVSVEMLGLLSATIGAGLAVRGIRGTSTPYSLPLMTLLIKLPTGALTAVGGLLLMHLITGFSITSTTQLAAYALVFGASQQTFTRLIDKQAQNVLDAVPASGKDAAKPATTKTPTSHAAKAAAPPAAPPP